MKSRLIKRNTNGVIQLKVKYRVLAFIFITLFVVNGLLTVNAAEEIPLTLTDEIKNVITDVEYGSTNATYQFDNALLDGVESDDEVFLVADAIYDSTDVGKTNITLTNFRLEGKDAAHYKLPEIDKEVVKMINITKKVIKIAPAKTYIYYGQTKPYLIDEIADYSSQIVQGDKVKLTAEFMIEAGNAIRDDYLIWINNDTLYCDNSNYAPELDDTISFAVREYEPLISYTTLSNDYVGVRTAILKAPDGFLISEDNQEDSAWSASIEIKLEETQSGMASYYLRCNDDSDMEYYQAISKKKIYNYTSFQTLPEIVSINIKKMEDDSILNLLSYGIFGNGNVNVTVEALGTTFEQETIIYLGGDEGYDSVTAMPTLNDDGHYHYTAIFTYNAFKRIDQMKAFAVNSSGTGEEFTVISGISDVDDSEKAIDGQPFVLENTEPEVIIGRIHSSNIQSVCNITITDTDSGIAKVEYGWDLDREFCDDEKNEQSGHYLGFRENDYTDQYVDFSFDNSEMVSELSFSLQLNYEDSVWVRDNKHTVYIRVTDNAGNVKCMSLRDTVGNDMFPPNITGIEIKKADKSAEDSILRFCSYGIFANDSVTIVISADDNEFIDNAYASGIRSVMVNDRTMVKSGTGEYVLNVLAEDMLSSMKITVEDYAGWVTEMAVTDIFSKEGLILSNDLIVENEAPSITWNFSAEGHLDNYGKIWYGTQEEFETIEITISDEGNSVGSGLYKVIVADNGTTLYESTEFTSIELVHTKSCFIGDLPDGPHTIVITAEDNAGNIVTDTRTFYIDSVMPEGGDISIEDPNGFIIDGSYWFDTDETITFRVDCSDSDSGLQCIRLNINDYSFSFMNDEILSDDKGNYVIIDTSDIDIDMEHKYTVSGIVADFANNLLILEPFTVYRDLEDPTINKLTVGNKNVDSGRGLNVLPFGAYSNDTLILKAYVSDAEFDSGIDYVTVFYDGLSEPETMTDEGGGVFSVEISSNEEISEYNFSVTVYDKFGRSSERCPNLENAVTGDQADFRYAMIETIEPSITFDLLTDDEFQDDGLKWYNSNQLMELKVQDENSGIRSVEFYVNEIDITSDKNGVNLLSASETGLATAKITEEQSYVFDTDYLTGITGEPDDGRYSIKISVTDNAGNINTYEMFYYIDMIDPQIDQIVFTPSTSDGVKGTEQFISELDYGFFFKTNFTVTIYISDETPSSGLDKLLYRFVPYQNGVIEKEVSGYQQIVDGKVELTVPQDFKGQLFLEAFDNLGNSSGEKTTKAYVVDNSAPEINVINNVSTSYVDANGNNLYVEDNSITVEITDMTSGIKELGYSQSSEKDSFDRVDVVLGNSYYSVGDILGDGWMVSAVDRNLVTKIIKTFRFTNDDNDIVMTFDATDNALNSAGNVQSEVFTVDKTDPIINISFRTDEGHGEYYNQNRVADVTVIERNFDENLIKVVIENTFGTVPSFSFTEQSMTEHVAVIDFDEGDYSFDVTGMDLGGHEAFVNYSGNNEKYFFVDKTIPETSGDFDLLVNDATENSFNYDKVIHIQVTEHNFDPVLTQLRINRKNAGEDHDISGLVDVTSQVLRDVSWNSEGDVHTISFTVSEDAVYQIELTPVDLAGNLGDRISTVVFEIDKTAPVVTAKNEIPVSADNTESIDIYSYARRDEPAPTVEFDDLNIDHINYSLTVYIPDHTSSEADTVIRPNKMYLEDDLDEAGIVVGNKFVMPDLMEDGVYALELIAVDVAGNESLLNVNTYARMIDQDVLAYIMESNLNQETGLYSFQYENGVAISKRPDDFKDIKICVLEKEDSDVDIVLRDSNGYEIITNAQPVIEDNVYGLNICNYTLRADFFKENFQDDTDMQLILTVRSEGNRIDLGKIHIDNIAPTCDIPEELRAWHWYYGEDARTIRLTNISELIDQTQCKVYDNGKEIEFVYSSADNTLEFTLERGWHSVGIVLSDMAGNVYNIQEISNIHIGFFWLWVIVAATVSLTILTVYVVIHYMRKRRTEESGD